MASSKPTLTYFNGRGRAEISRMILAEAGVEYDDVRVTDHTVLQDKLPFGQLPLYEEGNFKMVQSISIARYLARKYGLGGKNEHDAAHADMIVDGIVDLNVARNSAKTEEEKANVVKVTLPKWLGFFEALLKKNHEGKGHFVGENLTYADILMLIAIDNVNAGAPGLIDSYPLLKDLRERVACRPRIAAWIAKRPQTNF